MKNVVLFIAVAALLCFSLGCVHAPGGIAPSNVPIEGRKYQVVGDAYGTDSKIDLLGIIPISGGNELRDALDDAIQSTNAHALIDITVDVHAEYWILWSQVTTSVMGKAIRFQ